MEFKTSESGGLYVQVKDVRTYATLAEVLEKEDVDRIASGVSREQISKISEEIFREEDIKQHGLIVLDFERI